MAVSVSFGSSSPSVFGHNYDQSQQRQRHAAQSRDSDTSSDSFIPQTLVLGLFLLIFGVQVVVNMVNVRRVRVRRVGERGRERHDDANVDGNRDLGGAEAERQGGGEQDSGNRSEEVSRPAA